MNPWIAASLAGASLVVAGAWLIQTGSYGFTLFLLIPLLTGALAAAITRPETRGKAAYHGMLANLILSGSLLFIGVEGLICILMSWPLILPLGALGGYLAGWARTLPVKSMNALLLVPVVAGSLGFDFVAQPPIFEARTTLEIAAPPSTVWKHVVTFSDLPEPDDWYFRAGLAYPRRARIEGSGPGAIRYCEFSTGPFVEPIETWDEPRLLRFQVTENPAPMHEWSPYAHVVPRHLHDYFTSKRGQFRLVPLADGTRTRLEGTTWYQHGLWPAAYWQLWSDAIIHRIHLRVLTHIKTLSEAQ